jgi:hypothetical protein
MSVAMKQCFNFGAFYYDFTKACADISTPWVIKDNATGRTGCNEALIRGEGMD